MEFWIQESFIFVILWLLFDKVIRNDSALKHLPHHALFAVSAPVKKLQGSWRVKAVSGKLVINALPSGHERSLVS